MKFKMKTVLLVGSCLLWSVSQLQALVTVNFPCNEAMLRVASLYSARIDRYWYGHQHHHMESFICSDMNTAPQTVHVPAGNYYLMGSVGQTHCPLSDAVSFVDGETYTMRFDVTQHGGFVTGCTLSLQ